ncbi:MAG: sensor histidine kinase [Epsilonproteobacteria bacterium]|nr:sensor histidine kinase [Campylobacterota bacterium]
MQNLSTKILKKFIILSFFVLIVVGGVSYFWIKELYIEQIKKDLIHDVDLIALELQHSQDFQNIATAVKKLTSIRVTIVDKDGKVLADSDANATTMDNHKSRPEIFDSTYQPYGVSIRESKTLQQELLYVAKKIKIDDKEYFIRAATSFDEVYENFIAFSIKISIVFVLFLGAFVYITYKISDDIRYETDKILSFLKDMKNQTSASKISSDFSEEFQKITQHLSKLSQELAKKNKKKSKYTAKLKLANRQKDEILSAVSHEFKNPISVISGYSQTLVEDKDIHPRIRDKFLDKIHKNSMKLSAMIDRLRLFIKLEEDSQPIKYKPTNISTLVKDVIEDLKQSYPTREIEYKIKDDIVLDVDEALFVVAVKNLIENGLKYSEDEVYVKLTKDALSIEDKGVGIDKDEIEKITGKFYRVSSNGWDNSLGIGLSLVSHIVRVHGFKLDIKSTKLQGSIFSIYF